MIHRSSFVPVLSLSLTIASSLFATAPVRAQADFSENFENVGPVLAGQDGPSNLIAQGWIFRNQSQPRGTTTWHQGSWPEYSFQPHSGTGYIVVRASSTAWQGAVSNWAILPAIPGQKAGDIVSLYTRGYPLFETDNRIQVRYSPTGGTSTGTGVAGVGDFTQVLAAANPDSYEWHHMQATLPGAGRIAIRYYKPTMPYNPQDGQKYVIDTLTVSDSSPNPPLPAPGQTVHWTPAMSPVEIQSDLTIVKGGTVVIDPGVEVIVYSEAQLEVHGRLEGRGTPSSHVRLSGQTNTAQIATVGGDIDMKWADIHVQIGASIGTVNFDGVNPGSGVFQDCYFGTHAWLHDYWAFCSMDRCTFDTAYGPILYGALRLTDVTSTRTIQLNTGIFVLNNVRIEGASGASELDQSGLYYLPGVQPSFLEGVTVLNNQGAGIYLAGGNTLVGANNVIQGNKVAVELGAGLMAGSVIPTTGNLENGYISVGHATRPMAFPGAAITPITWNDVGLPYYVGDNWDVIGGGWTLRLKAGVDVRMGYNSVIGTDETGRFFADGRPGNPVTLAALDPSRPWITLALGTYGNRATDIDLSGSTRGFSTFLGHIADLHNSYIHDNQHGGVRGVRARKTLFTNNTVAGVSNIEGDIGSGVPQLTSLTNPNSFVNNTRGVWDAYQGAHFTIGAKYNWWGSPTGPRSYDNPTGTGDRADGDVETQPHRTTPPDFSDHPPIVEMAPINILEPGNKTTLRWNATDDRAIVKYRIAYAQGSNSHESTFITVVDNLPPDQFAYEWTVPEVGFSNYGHTNFLRVIATDDAGQEGYDELERVIPDRVRPNGTITFTPDLSGRVFTTEEIIPLELISSGGWDSDVSIGGQVHLELLNDEHSQYESFTYFSGEPLSTLRAPCVSTDQARLFVYAHGTYNRGKYFFTPTFSIRPDPRLGDGPPAITLTSPQSGQSFRAGDTIPVSWNSSDDNGVRYVRLFASYDGGRTWQKLADQLPGPSGGYDWKLAPGTGFPDVRLKAAAYDTRFQNSSAIATLTITDGSCLADYNGDGFVDGIDYDQFNNDFESTDPAQQMNADMNGDGFVDGIDYDQFHNAFEVGC